MNFESTVQTYPTFNIHNRHFKVLGDIDIYCQSSISMDNAPRDSAYCGLKNPQRKKICIIIDVYCIISLEMVASWLHMYRFFFVIFVYLQV